MCRLGSVHEAPETYYCAATVTVVVASTATATAAGFAGDGFAADPVITSAIFTAIQGVTASVLIHLVSTAWQTKN